MGVFREKKLKRIEAEKKKREERLGLIPASVVESSHLFVPTSSPNNESMPGIIAITISVNYSRKLEYIAEKNAIFFKKWLVVTSEEDTLTQEVCKKYPVITTMYHNFKHNKAVFDKGGALRMAQEAATIEYPDDYILILDSDIVLPPNFGDILNAEGKLKDNTIYGTEERRDFYKYSDLISEKNYKRYAFSTACVGYFTLYKVSNKKFYKHSYNCSTCDVEFRDIFRRKSNMRGLIVKHLGHDSVNWNGVNREDFEWEK